MLSPQSADIWGPIQEQLGRDLNVVQDTRLWIYSNVSGMIMAVIYFFFFCLVWFALSRFLKLVYRRVDLNETAANFVQEIVKYFVLCIGALSVLGALGVNTASLLASLGVLGLTLGFAARDTLSNLIAGIFIFWDRPFITGDLVEIEGVYGKVQVITLRSTRIVTVDGKMVAFPNTTIVNNKVVSYSNFPHLRLDVDVTIGVEEKIGQVRKLLLETLQATGKYMEEPPPTVVLKSINDYNLELQVRAWILDERQHVAERFALRELIFETLFEAGVDMPYETLVFKPTLPPTA